MQDAEALREVYGAGDAEEFAARLADRHTAPGTTHYVVEADGRVVAAFALTSLGRLRPGGRSRLFLHEIKLRSNVRGTGIADDILRWLSTGLGVGSRHELLALTPPGQPPAGFAGFGLTESHHVFKWAVPEGGGRP
ncbi:hypothetical protein AB0E74_09085 [Streptomyces sp. NPDC030392]|uniref:hypothetical protein n=1 Tax=Streptomyces sp. NPDC030392 TaxID=3155468 RepID=UPI003409E474